MKERTEIVISDSEFDSLVMNTYKRPYNFQQQDDCKDRGTYRITVPGSKDCDYENDTVPEIVNHEEMGVSFKSWLERDPEKPLPGQEYKYELDLWWTRNFYPHVQMIVNDLYSKGLLKSGNYAIDVDW